MDVDLGTLALTALILFGLTLARLPAVGLYTQRKNQPKENDDE